MLSRSVVSNSLQPHGLQPARLLCPWRFSRQEYWSGLPCPPSGGLPNSGTEPRYSTLQVDSLPSEPSEKHMVSRWITTNVRKKNHSEEGTWSPEVTLLVAEQQSDSESLSWPCGLPALPNLIFQMRVIMFALSVPWSYWCLSKCQYFESYRQETLGKHKVQLCCFPYIFLLFLSVLVGFWLGFFFFFLFSFRF